MLKYVSTRVSAGAFFPLFAAILGGPGLVFAAESSGIIEEVTVTAQRTAESIQDVPIAVTALTGDMLRE